MSSKGWRRETTWGDEVYWVGVVAWMHIWAFTGGELLYKVWDSGSHTPLHVVYISITKRES